MIDVDPISQNEWLVTVQAHMTTNHRVRVTPDGRRNLMISNERIENFDVPTILLHG